MTLPTSRALPKIRSVTDTPAKTRRAEQGYASSKKIETVTQDLENRVHAREWGEDESLPSQISLSKEYGVSPATIAIAIRSLQKKGLLHVVPGRGAFAAEPNSAQNGNRIHPTIGLRGSYVRTVDGSPTKPGAYGAAVVQAIWGAAQIEHCPLLLLPGTAGQNKLSKQYCQSQGVQGVIFLGGESYEEAIELRSAGFPVIIANEPPGPTPINFVNYDHASYLREATQKFIKAGHRRIAVMFPSTTMPGSYHKLKPDFIDTLSAEGIPYNADYWRFIPRDPSNTDELHKATTEMESLLDLEEPPTAVFCWSPSLVTHILKVLGRRGLTVPKDLSLISSPYEAYRHPDISGYETRHDELARELLKGVYETIKNPFHSVQKLIPLTFVDRGTVAPPLARKS